MTVNCYIRAGRDRDFLDFDKFLIISFGCREHDLRHKTANTQSMYRQCYLEYLDEYKTMFPMTDEVRARWEKAFKENKEQVEVYKSWRFVK